MTNEYFVEIKKYCFSHEDAKMVEGEIVDSWPDDWIHYSLNIWTKHRASVQYIVRFDLSFDRHRSEGSRSVGNKFLDGRRYFYQPIWDVRDQGAGTIETYPRRGSTYFRNWKKYYVVRMRTTRSQQIAVITLLEVEMASSANTSDI